MSDMPDFIEGVDQIPQKGVTDFNKNAYGDLLCELLTDCKHNDFTCISTRERSVVGYIIVPYEDLEL